MLLETLGSPGARASEPQTRSGGFRLARVQAKLEECPELLAEVVPLRRRRLASRQQLHGVLGVAPAVTALVALRLAERPESLHSAAG